MTKQTVFVTGSTGLLGNNLVRMLLEKGVRVRALVRSRAKAQQQFAGLNVEIVEGDMGNVSGFSHALSGVDTVFHTAAFFRDNYKGGRHWDELYQTNVKGTADLLAAAYQAGVRRFVHTSSIAVLDGKPDAPIDETMLRDEANADDYFRSKILSEREVLAFLERHPDMGGVVVLPGWMHGPGDAGPTSAGQTVLDFVNRKLPGVIPVSFSVVDARDVAQALILASEKGRRGERYLAAGNHYTMAELMDAMEKVSGVSAPRRNVPIALLYIIAFIQELWARVSGKPVLLSMATVRLITHEAGKTHFNAAKSQQELGLTFRPLEETLRDVIQWYRTNGRLT